MRWFFMMGICVLGVGFLGSLPVWAHGDHDAHAETVPLEHAIPDQSLVRVDVPVQGEEGVPVHVQLFSPKAKFFPSTDFPIVEGTQLLDGTFTIHDGKVSFEYMFPIRGTYQLVIEGVGANSSSPQVKQLEIRENPEKIRNAVIFVSGLLLFGFACGFLLTNWRRRVDAAM